MNATAVQIDFSGFSQQTLAMFLRAVNFKADGEVMLRRLHQLEHQHLEEKADKAYHAANAFLNSRAYERRTNKTVERASKLLAAAQAARKRANQYYAEHLYRPTAGDAPSTPGGSTEARAAATLFRRLLLAHAVRSAGPIGEQLLAREEVFKDAYRMLALRMHPDRGGTHHAWVEFQQAAEVLKKHHGLA